MSATKITSDMLTKILDELARQVGEMDPDDPLRAERLKELCELTALRKSPRSELDKLIHKRLAELASEVKAVEQSDPRQIYIVSQILRLSNLISK